MALTVNTQPQTLTPAYNKQVFKATSDQTAVSDFTYIVTLECNASGDVFTEYIAPAPDTTMTFDAMEYVKNYVTHYFNPSATLNIATGKVVSVVVNIKEYYTAAIQSTTTIEYNAFDACLNDVNFAAYNYTNYLMNTSLVGLSNVAIDNRIDVSSDFWFHFISYPSHTYTDVKIVDTNTSDEVSYTIPTAVNDYEMYVLRAKPSLISPTPLVGHNYQVQLINSNVLLNKFYSYTITSIDTNYSTYKLYYLDATGNILFFNFELVSQETINKQTNSVRLSNNTGNSWEREKHIVSTQTTKQIVLNSDWITETQSTALANLFDSPIVWLYINNTYTPVTITETNYKLNKYANESLFNYVVTCEYGLTNTRQRGI